MQSDALDRLRLSWLGHAPTLMALSMVFWIATEAGGAAVLQNTPIPQVVWLRYLVHLGVMLVVFGPRHGVGLVRTSRPMLQLGRSLLMLGMPLSFMIAAREMPPARVWGGFWMTPTLILLLARMGGARVAWSRWLLAAMGWLGAMAVYGPPLPQPLALAATFGMAATFSLYVIWTAELDRTESFLTNLFYSALGVFLGLSVGLPWWWTPLTVRAVAGGAVVACFGWLTLAAMDLALRLDRPSRLAVFFFSQIPAHELLLGLAGHRPSKVELVGTVVVSAVLLAGLVLHRPSEERV